MPVTTVHAQYDHMITRWSKCRDFYEGSYAVKAKGDEYLPRIGGSRRSGVVGESTRAMTTADDRYASYLERALFYNGMRRTVEGLSGAIFQKTPDIEAPNDVEEHLNDITLSDISFDSFALLVTQALLVTGRHGILVSSNEERPYWGEYQAEDILSWRTDRIEGNQVVTRVVLSELYDSDGKDEFEVDTLKQYRVLDIDSDGFYRQRLYRQQDKHGKIEQVEFANGDTDFFAVRRGQKLAAIPFTFLGPHGVSVNVVRPPLEDLCDVNLSHYQTSADLEWGAHFTALPTPVIAGELANKQTGPLEIGSTVAWQLSSGSQWGMLEFSGAGLGALEKREDAKRKMMATLGARMLEDRPAQAETSGAVMLRHSGESANLRTVAGSVDQGMTSALRWHVWWTSTEEKPGDLVEVTVDLNKDFVNVKATPQEVAQMMLLIQSDLVSYDTFYTFLQNGEWARPGASMEDELKEIAKQSHDVLPTPEPPPLPQAFDNTDDDDDDLDEDGKAVTVMRT